MARPKLGESESRRLQMVITDDELKAIEDWQFDNRVPSKSEAIRRLCQIGAPVDGELEEAIEHARDLREVADQQWSEDLRIIRENRDNPDREYVDRLGDRLAVSHDILDRADRLYLLLVAAWNRIVPLIDGKNFTEAVKGSEEAVAESRAIFAEIRRRDRRLEENGVLVSVSNSQTKEKRDAYNALSEDEQNDWWEKKILEALGPFDDEGEGK